MDDQEKPAPHVTKYYFKRLYLFEELRGDNVDPAIFDAWDLFVDPDLQWKKP